MSDSETAFIVDRAALVLALVGIVLVNLGIFLGAKTEIGIPLAGGVVLAGAISAVVAFLRLRRAAKPTSPSTG